MKISVMQPYLFPYLGYFQLIHEADKFVFFDDVNFITRGWINRNNILLHGKAHLFTVPLKNASQHLKINEVLLAYDNRWLKGFLNSLEHAYKKAPYYTEVKSMIESVFNTDHSDVGKLAEASVREVFRYLGEDAEYTTSSSLDYLRVGNGQDKIISICRTLDTTFYINPFAGHEMYDRSTFLENEIDIGFLKMNPLQYAQWENSNFVQNLSIIDILMFRAKEEVRTMLGEYIIVEQ